MSNELVLPGDVLGVIEEYFPGQGAYQDDDGNVRSQIIGIPAFDLKGHVATVRGITSPMAMPKKNDVVLARITDVKSNIASAKIFQVEGKHPRSPYLFSGFLHVSRISTSYVRSIYDAVRIGDVIRAQVLTSTPPYILSIRGKNYGVVLAYCSSCLGPLILRSISLYCPRCKKMEKRKVAFKYYIRLRV